MTFQIRFTSPGATPLVGATTGFSVIPPSGPPLYPGESARYAPTQRGALTVEYNTTTKRHQPTATTAAWLAYATNEPTSSVTITEQGSPALNRAALVAAIAGRGTTGPCKIRIANGIRITGEEIDIPPVYTSGGILRWTYIESVSVGAGTLRGEGQRVSLADDASLMAKMEMQTYNQRIFNFTNQTNGVRLTGLHFRVDTDLVASIRASQFGQNATVGGPGGGNSTWTYMGYLGWDVGNYSTSPLTRQTGEPQNIIVDRCILEGDDQIRFRRLLLANFHRFALINSWAENAGDSNNGDAQVIAVLSCTGDHYIWNNEMACAWGEHVIYGGGNAWAEQYVPKDMVVGYNRLTFRPRWHTQGRLHKNMLETKIGQRITWEGNLIENYYGFNRLGSQLYAIVAKSSDQGTGEVFASASDIVIRLNKLVRSSGFFVIQGGDYFGGGDYRATHKVDFSHNVQLPWNPADLGIAEEITTLHGLRIGGERTGTFFGSDEWKRVTDIAIRHNAWYCATRIQPTENYKWAMSFGNAGNPPEMRRWDISNNVLAGLDIAGGWGIIANYEDSPNTTVPLPVSWTFPVKTAVVSEGNLVTGISDQAAQLFATLGSTNRGALTLAAAGINSTTLTLGTGTIGKGIAQDGGDPGPDYDLIAACMVTTETGRGY
jgi:hypothetical protein